MNWATFYLICFVVGLVFSLFSVFGTLGRFSSGHLHLPHFLGHGGGPVHTAPVNVHAVASVASLRGPAGAKGVRGSHVSFFNFSSLLVFFTWFGGTGYLLTRYSDLLTVATFGIALTGGLAGAGIVFFFLVKLLLAHETELDPADFDRTGVLGKVNVTIRAGGTGEIVFSQAGTRHAAGARSEESEEIPKGTEVIITHYEKGIAYVRRYDDMAGERQVPSNAAGASRE